VRIQGEHKNVPTRKSRYLRNARIFFVLNSAHSFRRQLCKSVLLCAVFTWHTTNWRKRKLQERILQLYKRLILLRATACNAIARLCYGRGVLLSVCLSVCPSATLLYCVKTTQLRIMKSSLCDSLEFLVSNEVILVPLGEEIPLERGHLIGVPPPPLEIVILTTIWLI